MLFGLQGRVHTIQFVTHTAKVRHRVIAATEDGLQIDGYAAVAWQQGNGYVRQAILEADRVDREGCPGVEGVNADTVQGVVIRRE